MTNIEKFADAVNKRFPTEDSPFNSIAFERGGDGWFISAETYPASFETVADSYASIAWQNEGNDFGIHKDVHTLAAKYDIYLEWENAACVAIYAN